MKPKIVCSCFLIVVLATLDLHGIHREPVGWNRLAAEFGDDLPIGRNIGVSMIESPPFVSNYQPNATNPEFNGKTFEMKSGESAVSEHATVVEQLFFDNTMSIAPGIDTIDVYNANSWVVETT